MEAQTYKKEVFTGNKYMCKCKRLFNVKIKYCFVGFMMYLDVKYITT